MENIDQKAKEESIKSLESTYRKLSNAYMSMSEKGSNTTLVEKRRNCSPQKILNERLKRSRLDVQ
ncbi:hypothetical protein GCM10007275_03200 [Jeotgalicoccus coquinae]|uniref:Uncharacterized protein n=1 Tax=Jeotgalicoccus coquinae TaxID=709509 RepID=A0A6V7R7U2_9STAP|nr:hypothetical protein [Jeotgalicoccus coquinae]GGE11366.1 hypothetical protein GCM10007275_03200 [Jeotgalicoccus coquinae]CAD2073519.1 hypothetical protein JEOCOQ751_00668 [Jeotgalicoccus coquinae]